MNLQLHHVISDITGVSGTATIEAIFMIWDESALNRQRIARMQTLPGEGDGVLIFDDTGFEKRGRHSVGWRASILVRRAK